MPSLRTLVIVAGVAGAIAVACGGNGGGGRTDAPVAADAKTFLDGGAPGLGKICTGDGSGDPSLCPARDPMCVTAHAGAVPVYFCTKSCGTSSSPSVPPADGDATCMAMEQTAGTPRCMIPQSGSGSAYPWACGIMCGSYMGSDFGTCPTGLTCMSNICQ